MHVYDPEPRRCDRTRAHRRHDYVTAALSTVVYECPGRGAEADNLAELLHRRPELADLTPAAVANRLAVSAA